MSWKTVNSKAPHLAKVDQKLDLTPQNPGTVANEGLQDPLLNMSCHPVVTATAWRGTPTHQLTSWDACEVAMIQRLISPERRRFTPATNLRFIAKFIKMLGTIQRNIGFSLVLDVDRDGSIHDSTQDPKGVWYLSGIKTNKTNWTKHTFKTTGRIGN